MVTTNDAVRVWIRLTGVVLIPVAVLLLVRFYIVQVDRHEYYRNHAEKIVLDKKELRGKRGEIFDSSGYLLVGNTPCVEITCSPYNLDGDGQRRGLARMLTNYFGGSEEEYYRRLAPTRFRRDREGNIIREADGSIRERPNQYLMIARNCPLDRADAFRKEAGEAGYGPALYYRHTTIRTYPKGRLLANVLGYINIVNDAEIPQSGLEKQLEPKIEAAEGLYTYERTRDGTPLLYGFQELRESHDGKNVYLTISEPIQSILEEELDAAFAEWNPDAIYAAIADPASGNILALAQRPTFDPNDRSTYAAAAIGTRIAEDAFEPGSIAKPFTIGKALDWGFVRPDDVIDCEKGMWIYLRRAMTDSHRYDKLTVSGIIQKSSNIGTAKIALMLGDERVYQALSSFGFGRKTGLPFAREHAGVLHPVKKWDGLTGTRVAIGYSMMASPLQLLRAYCALANGGRMPELRLIDRLEDPVTGEITYEGVRPPVQLFEHPEVCGQLVEMMRTVAETGGTAAKAALKGYSVAGKTGTSRKYIAHHGYSRRQYYASFVGFAPATRPRLVMLVTFDSPKNAMYGGQVAAPVFRRVMERALRYLNVPPDLPEAERHVAGR